MFRRLSIWILFAFVLFVVLALLNPPFRPDIARASLGRAESLVEACVLFSKLRKTHDLPRHFAELYYDPVVRGEGVRLNMLTTSTSVPSFNTDWTLAKNWAEITAATDRCSDYHYVGAGLRRPASVDAHAADVVVFYSKSTVLDKGYLVAFLDGGVRYVVPADMPAVLARSKERRHMFEKPPGS